jgi:hypothetical protein
MLAREEKNSSAGLLCMLCLETSIKCECFYNFGGKEEEGHLGLWSQTSETNGRTNWSVELFRG